MQVNWSEHLYQLLHTTPTVGALMDLCEENYQYLQRMVPDMAQMRGVQCSTRPGHTDLYLEVLEQSKYTSLIHLTYYFEHSLGQEPDPDVVLRVYHDACQVEVIDLKQHTLPTDSLYEAPGLLNKWRANLFMAKWLAFCVSQGHGFGSKMAISA